MDKPPANTTNHISGGWLTPQSLQSIDTFRAQEYLDVFEILRAIVTYRFDSNMDYATISQALVVKKVNKDGPNGWCALVDPKTQEYFRYRASNDGMMSTRYIRDARGNHYMVADFDRIEQSTVMEFTTETRQRIDSLSKNGSKARKSFILTRLFGSAVEDCRIKLEIPGVYKLINSIPPPDVRDTNSYQYRTEAGKLQPVQIAVEVRRRRIQWLGKILGTNTHWLVQTLIGAIVVSLLGTIAVKSWNWIKH